MNAFGSNTAASALTIDGGTVRTSGPGHSTYQLFTLGAAGGTLDSSGSGVTFLNSGAIGFSGTGSRTFTLSGTSVGALTPVIGDPSGGVTSLVKAGSGTWEIRSAGTYTGSTTLNAGTLVLGAGVADGGVAGGLGASTSAASNRVLNGGRLEAFGSTDRLFTLGSSAALSTSFYSAPLTFTNTGAIAFAPTIFSSGRFLTLMGRGSGAGTLTPVVGDGPSHPTHITKTEAGTWVLAGTNTYTGVTSLQGGVLSVSLLADGGAASNIGAAGSAAANLELRGGTLRYTGAGASTDRLFTLWTNTGSALDASGSGTLAFPNIGAVAFALSGARTLTLTGTGNGSLAPLLGDGTGGATSLTKSGTGVWTLTNANTYTGVTTLNAGVLSVASLPDGGVAGPIGAATSAAGNLVLNGGTLRYTGAGASTDRLFTLGVAAGSRLESAGTGTLVFGNPGAIAFTDSGARTLTLGGSGDGSLAAALGDGTGGATSLTKTGAGTWTLAGTNTFTGTVTVSQGTLRLGSAGALGGGATLAFNPAAGDTAVLQLNGHDATTAGLGSSGAGDAVVENGAAGTATLTVSVAGTTTFAGTLRNGSAGTLALTKAGAGTLVLAGANTYTGATTVNGGTLRIDGSLSGASAVSVNSGSTLGGGGTVDGAVTVAAGATLAPGASPGALTLTGGLSLDGAYAWELSAPSDAPAQAGVAYDQIILTDGGLSLGTGSTLNLLFGAGLAPDGGDPFWSQARSWTIIDNTGAGSISGTFASIDQAVWAAGTFGVVHGTGAGGDVTLEWTPTPVPVPEPAALALLAAGLALMTAVRRRARSERGRPAA